MQKTINRADETDIQHQKALEQWLYAIDDARGEKQYSDPVFLNKIYESALDERTHFKPVYFRECGKVFLGSELHKEYHEEVEVINVYALVQEVQRIRRHLKDERTGRNYGKNKFDSTATLDLIF